MKWIVSDQFIADAWALENESFFTIPIAS